MKCEFVPLLTAQVSLQHRTWLESLGSVCRPVELGGRAQRNVIATLQPFLLPRSREAKQMGPAEDPTPPSEPLKESSDTKAQAVGGDVLVFLSEKAVGGRVASLAIQACQHLTSIPHDCLLPAGTAAEVVKLNVLLSGRPFPVHLEQRFLKLRISFRTLLPDHHCC